MYITIPRMITNNANKSSVKSTFTFFITVPSSLWVRGASRGGHSAPASLGVVLPNSSPLKLLFITCACLCYAHMPLFKYSENASTSVKASTQQLIQRKGTHYNLRFNIYRPWFVRWFIWVVMQIDSL